MYFWSRTGGARLPYEDVGIGHPPLKTSRVPGNDAGFAVLHLVMAELGTLDSAERNIR
jgi:hypothetical protein